MIGSSRSCERGRERPFENQTAPQLVAPGYPEGPDRWPSIEAMMDGRRLMRISAADSQATAACLEARVLPIHVHRLIELMSGAFEELIQGPA